LPRPTSGGLQLLRAREQPYNAHSCVLDHGPNRPARPGEPTYCVTHYTDGMAVYRRDGQGHLIQGWHTWLVDASQADRWASLRDSLTSAVAHLVGGTPACRVTEPVGRVRITSWRLNGYEAAVVTHEPAGGEASTFEVTVALGPLNRCGES